MTYENINIELLIISKIQATRAHVLRHKPEYCTQGDKQHREKENMACLLLHVEIAR